MAKTLSLPEDSDLEGLKWKIGVSGKDGPMKNTVTMKYVIYKDQTAILGINNYAHLVALRSGKVYATYVKRSRTTETEPANPDPPHPPTAPDQPPTPPE